MTPVAFTDERVASIPFPNGVYADWLVPSPDGRTLLTQDRRVNDAFNVRVWDIET